MYLHVTSTLVLLAKFHRFTMLFTLRVIVCIYSCFHREGLHVLFSLAMFMLPDILYR